MWLGGALQMIAAFILLALCHYFAAGFLPIADCDETFNFVEPIHHLLYGSGLQTWENPESCEMHSWLFTWFYAAPAFLVAWMPSLRKIDVYFFIRIFHGRVACINELFLVYSVWATFSGRAAVVTFVLLLLNYPITYAAASARPTSFVMTSYFIALGCWIRTGRFSNNRNGSKTSNTNDIMENGSCRDADNNNNNAFGAAASHLIASVRMRTNSKHGAVFFTIFFVLLACLVGCPFTGLTALPVVVDLLLRFPRVSVLSLLLSLILLVPLSVSLDALHYRRMTWSIWNLLRHSLLASDAERRPEWNGVEPWYYYIKNMLVNAQLLLLSGLAAPLVILLQPLSSGEEDTLPATQPIPKGVRRRCGNGVAGGVVREREGGGCETWNIVTGRESRGSVMLRMRALFPLSQEKFGASIGPFSPLSTPRSLEVAARTAVSATKQEQPSRVRMLLYISPFFLRCAFWLAVPHKVEYFMTPVYPFLVLAAALCFTQVFFPGNLPQPVVANSSLTPGWRVKLNGSRPRRVASPHSSRWLPFLGSVLLLLFGAVSFSRSIAIYSFYAGPQRLLYDNYAVLQTAATQKMELQAVKNFSSDDSTPVQLYTLCMGSEWFRFPSSFFLDRKRIRVAFIKKPTCGEGPQCHFSHHDTGEACCCGVAGVKVLDGTLECPYVSDVAVDCDTILGVVDSSEPTKSTEYPRDVFTHPFPTSQWLLDVERTPVWCRVLYYPFGITEHCAVWYRLELLSKSRVVTVAAANPNF